MPTPPGDAPIALDPRQIENLARLYDRFTNPIDPFDPEQEAHESLFNREVARLYDGANLKSISFHVFRLEIIRQCRAHLKATKKFPSV